MLRKVIPTAKLGTEKDKHRITSLIVSNLVEKKHKQKLKYLHDNFQNTKMYDTQ